MPNITLPPGQKVVSISKGREDSVGRTLGLMVATRPMRPDDSAETYTVHHFEYKVDAAFRPTSLEEVFVDIVLETSKT